MGERPDPDRLLEAVNAEAERARRARLRVFFGFAPGVGKTYRMLQVARELVDQKVDVVVGAVETHGRYDTSALTLGLEILPRRQVEYRGRTLDELDLDAALTRKPTVLLLDELAHTNAPGSRHLKRWQDVVELLDAGIDVYTTLNVQHVESLNDVVAQITHVQVRETVPDSILDRADVVELVDVAPEELLQRLQEGKVYFADQAARAASGFFQRGNLLALRELALRRTAERVDADVLRWREQQGVAAPWATVDRILVGIGPAPASARLVRSARRMAAGVRVPWVAAWVDTGRPLSEDDRQRLDAHLRLAESLGGSVVRLTGTRVATALLDYARTTNVTRLLIGKPTHATWRDRLGGSLVNEVVRGSGDIDVHVITGDASSEAVQAAPTAREPKPPVAATSWLGAAALVALMTGLAVGIRVLAPVPDLELLYLVAVVIAAVRFGQGPSLLAAALSVAAYDFVFVPPYYTFAVADARYVLTFAMLFGASLFTGSLAARIRRDEQKALAREEHTRSLYSFSRDVGDVSSEDQVAAVAAHHVARTLRRPVVVLLERSGALVSVAADPTGATLGSAELAVAQWVVQHGRPAGRGTDTLPGANATCFPIRAVGTVAVVMAGDARLDAEQRSVLEAICSQTASAIERLRLADDARIASLRARTEELRSSLLSTVSHDLRTPLAAITGAATTLADASAPVSEVERRELLDTICDEAERLERLVANLLDMTRLESGGLQPRREWVPLVELVGSALSRVEKKLEGREVTVRVADGLPLLSVDPVLVEQVLVNLLENATKHTPAGSAVEVEAGRDGGSLWLEVRDHGPGVPEGAEGRVFEKFFRGPSTTPGAGLGLAICRGIVEAHGGSISARNRVPHGAVFRVTLPVPEGQPA